MGETPAWRSANGWVRLFAVVLSIVVPGVGHGLAGRPLRGASVAIGFALVGALAVIMFVTLPTVVGVILPLLLAASARIWSGMDAARVTRESGRWRWAPRLSALVLVALVAYVLDAAGEQVRARFVSRAYRLPSGSMEPTLLEGDYFVARPLGRSAVRRGDVVTFVWPYDSLQSHVSRVVGLPGDTIAMRAETLMVNGRSVPEPYASYTPGAADSVTSDFEWQRPYALPVPGTVGEYRASVSTWGPLEIPQRMYFVLGDNRDNSLDSRYVGFVAAAGLRALPHRVYFSRDPSASNVRWSRIGMILQRPPA